MDQKTLKELAKMRKALESIEEILQYAFLPHREEKTENQEDREND